MQAATHDPLFADWFAKLGDPDKVTSQSAKLVAARAQSLVEDWDVAAAMVRALILATHGARGLRFRSHFQRDDAPGTDDSERETRRQIEAAIASRPDIDASGTMSRRKIESCIDWHATVMGDGFAVRVWQGAGRWRVIHPFRVRNPAGKTNDDRWQDGIELGADGRPVRLWIDPQRSADLTMPSTNTQPVEWYAPDGTPNVIHRVRWQIPGAIRGLSSFAPLMLPARMLQGVSEAYVASKRVQAGIPLLMTVPDVEKAREQYRGSRIANLLMGPNSEVTFPSWKFEGDDYQAFTDTEIRNICAAWGIPWELVLGDHSAKSGASARSMWQAFYQQADCWQQDHAEQCSTKIDEAIVRERQITNPIAGLTDDWRRNMMGVYQGPARIMPDPLKEAQAAETWSMLGRSKSSAFAEQGWDYREETVQKSQDEELAEAQGVGPESPPAPPAAPVEPEPAPEPAGEEDEPMKASDMVQIIQAMSARESQPVQIVQRMEVGADSAKILGEAIAANMPKPEAAIVNVPQQLAPVIHVAAAAPLVTVSVPQAQPPVVMVAAAKSPEVHVHVPESKQRKQRAVEQKDGSIILEDVT